jgi:hypothetical protein
MVAWLQTAFSHPASVLALVIKLTSVTLLSAVLCRRIPDLLTSWLHAWLGVQTVQIAAILVLSSVSALSRSVAWGCLILMLLVASGAYFWKGVRFSRPSALTIVLGAVVALPLVLWALRSVLIPDYTPDGQAYGTVRIGLWMNYRSVFVHMPTIMVNIFADEWNGEMNGLFYAFSAGNIQGAVMGNAEILIVAAIAAIWVARRFGASASGSALVGLMVATSPAFVGLAAVTKGDLLACVGVLMAIGMLERPTARSICLAAAWFALAAGSKVSVLPGAVMVLGCLLAMHFRLFLDKRSLGLLLAAAAFSVLFVARFEENYVIYGHPFMRIGAEAAEPGMRTLIGNMSLIGQQFVGFFPVSASGMMFSTSLAAGLGVCGWLAALGAATGRLRLPGTHTMLAVLCMASIALTAFLIPPRIWSFRYFLPFISTLAIMGLVALTQALEVLPPLPRAAAVLALICAAAFDYRMCFIPGDISAPHDFKTALDYSASTSPVQRPMLNFPQVLAEANPAALGLDTGVHKKIAILNQLGAPILIFEGSGAQNRLYLAADQVGLIKTAIDHDADMVVIAKSPVGHITDFDVSGYHWVTDGQNYRIALRN